MLLKKLSVNALSVVRAFFTTPVFFGKSLSHVPYGSLVFFPCTPYHLCCGITGILEYKGAVQKTEEMPQEHQSILRRLHTLCPTICKCGFNTLLRGNISLDEYLGGEETLHTFKDAILTLKGIKIFEHLFKDDSAQKTIKDFIKEMDGFLTREETSLDKSSSKIDSLSLEIINRRIIILKDCLWWLEKELLLNIEKVSALIKPLRDQKKGQPLQLIHEIAKINLVLNNLNYLEVRGRDSAGISVMIQFPDQNAIESLETLLKENKLYEEYISRRDLKDLTHKTILTQGNTIFFSFKTAKELGKLGDNVLFLREAIAHDQLFFHALAYPGIYVQVLAHTRWASVGGITEVNCHPLNNLVDSNQKVDTQIQVVLNGDIDNYQDLKQRLEEEDGIFIPPYVTTDTKIIPLWVEHYLRKGVALKEAFRLAVSDFQGSHAIALQTNSEPGRLYLAQRGSGQTLFIGLGIDCYVIASEVYGLVEQTPLYIKMDGGKEGIPGKKELKGQIILLDYDGGIKAMNGWYYDGHPIPIDKRLIKTAQITTRDIDRQGFPHYYLKEINQSPNSVRKTIRGKYAVIKKEGEKEVIFNLGEEMLPVRITDALKDGTIKHVYLVGQGTAGVAAEGIAMLMSKYLSRAPLTVSATKASELSGFGLEGSMADTLVIAVTQSGTTTDTNKTVDMAKSHKAFTLGIVNRRDSDITTKVDGVFYTSDGRDIEMSVASTKAFYAQIVAGCILGLRFAQILGTQSDSFIATELRDLLHIPKLMEKIINEQQEAIAIAASSLALKKRNWAVVGSGPNKVAADEIRIKLSELCYKTLPSDVVEDRKHIDLSAEPLIIVCSAGNREIVLGDIIKDTAIFNAHQATVVCIASEGEERFNTIADVVFTIPQCNERLAPILNTVVGHLWGYYVARAINAEADFFRQFRILLQKKLYMGNGSPQKSSDILYGLEIRSVIQNFIIELMQKKEEGRFDGAVSPRTLCNLALTCRYAAGQIPSHEIANDLGPLAQQGEPPLILSRLMDEIIGQLSRPIDAIKHQAKTVTVGTSRLTVAYTGVIFDLLSTLGFGTTDMAHNVLFNVKNIQPVIEKVNGATLYHITGLDPFGSPTPYSQITIVKRYGVARQIPSRVQNDHTLRGTKRSVIKNSEVYIGRGLWDKAQILILPLPGKKEGERYLVVVHISFLEKATLEIKIKAMGMKYNDVIDIVTEWNIPWNDALLDGLSPEFLMSTPEDEIAEKIREYSGAL